ncbi:DUF2793 domain-containing protein [Asticcacaulis sp. AND118]|uniref:DUF2793 domain-containing protein n=1 Tax=Asticcacaulis sp. AND118 TaxID=2840468 RepID=UPI001CFFD72A|nr:DUF2793 domain-containing protein [Asticcacaulis sp. AND118]UDF02607.1 DUF2793 domain-containing protein [Asticcacaulis sp. AND118]
MLGLPLLQSGQAQKHITLNESLWRLDALIQSRVKSRTLVAQPSAPQAGEAYILPEAASGAAWDDYAAGDFVVFQGGYWDFLDLPEGALVHVADEGRFVVRTASGWTALQATIDALQGLERLGVGATADATNRLSVNSPQVLFNHAGGGSLLALNKATASHEAGIVFQTGFSTRALLGTLGDDRLTLKTSTDGSTFSEALSIETDRVALHRPLKPATDNGVSLGGAGARWSEVWAASGVVQTSDGRDKRVTGLIDPTDALTVLDAVPPVRFYWREGEGTTAQAGFLAQDVRKGLELAALDLGLWGLEDVADPSSRQWLRPDQLLAVLWAAVKGLRAELSGKSL